MTAHRVPRRRCHPRMACTAHGAQSLATLGANRRLGDGKFEKEVLTDSDEATTMARGEGGAPRRSQCSIEKLVELGRQSSAAKVTDRPTKTWRSSSPWPKESGVSAYAIQQRRRGSRGLLGR